MKTPGKTLSAILAVFAVAAASAQTPTQQTRANLYSEISTNLPTNGANEINALALRQVVNDIAASSTNPLTDGAPGNVTASPAMTAGQVAVATGANGITGLAAQTNTLGNITGHPSVSQSIEINWLNGTFGHQNTLSHAIC